MKKIYILLALLLCVNAPSFAQRKQVVKALTAKVPAAPAVKPVAVGKVPSAVRTQKVISSLSRFRIPSLRAIKADYLKSVNLARPNHEEFMEQMSKHGVVVREVNLPETGNARAFTEDGENWFYSPEALWAIDDGFFVSVLNDNKGIVFSVDGQAPFFDFYDFSVMQKVQELKNLGFVLQPSGAYFMVEFPQTPVSETPVFLSLEHKNPMSLKYAPTGTFVRIRKNLPFADVPYPDLHVGRLAEAKPEGVSWDEWTNHLMGYMQDVSWAYSSLERLVGKLGPYRDSVDIVWMGSSWGVRDAQGRLYNSAEDFFAEGVVQDSSRFQAGF